MFTRADFSCIDKEYFEVKTLTGFHIILKSRNTGHTWDIESRQLTAEQGSIVVNHKHKDGDPFHPQPLFHPKNILEAQELIKAHDEWYIEHQGKTG